MEIEEQNLNQKNKRIKNTILSCFHTFLLLEGMMIESKK